MNLWTYVWLVSITIVTLYNLIDGNRLIKTNRALTQLLSELLFKKMKEEMDLKIMSFEEFKKEMNKND